MYVNINIYVKYMYVLYKHFIFRMYVYTICIYTPSDRNLHLLLFWIHQLAILLLEGAVHKG